MMNFISTRDATITTTLAAAIRSGLAADGGLFVPKYLPKIEIASLDATMPYPVFAAQVLQAFFADDVLHNHLLAICQAAFTFPVILDQLNSNTYMLELYHGPTLSFKDFGARFLAECLNVIANKQKTTILVATSGDTGSAVASAFYRKSNINVIILYPKGQISAKQERQITCWDENILSLAVDGNFDTCQQLVKAAFNDPWWEKYCHLSSANSINIGRLLPQITYYAYSSIKFYQQSQLKPGYVIPTGNLGNATAAYYAKLMGFPIREIVLATNANQVISNYLATGKYQARNSISTIANAMDVGNPSNFERLQHLFNSFNAFKANVQTFSVSDQEIRQAISNMFDRYQTIVCPHTATACFTREKLSNEPWIIVATADPSKFDSIIAPLIDIKIPIPRQLQALLDKPAHVIDIAPRLNAIQEKLPKHWLSK